MFKRRMPQPAKAEEGSSTATSLRSSNPWAGDPVNAACKALGLSSDKVPEGDCTFYCVILGADWTILAHGRLEGLGWTMRGGAPSFTGSMEIEVIRAGLAFWAATYAVGSNGGATLLAVTDEISSLTMTPGDRMTWNNNLNFTPLT